jgi:outer membrane cobalamin receptor
MFVKTNVMRFLVIVILMICTGGQVFAQTQISGVLKTRKQEPVAGASITLEGTYYGATSSDNGNFSFTSSDTGTYKLVVTAVGFKNLTKEIRLMNQPLTIDIILAEAVTELQAVIISAGTFEASDKKRNTVLKPLDVVTTAGQQADIVAALNTLPGAQQVGESEGLFVRGGTGAETKVFIDGMMVTNPFFSSVPEVAQRGRFSPLLFKGTNFSSGGYSSQFGQGLSSALTLETHDLPTRTETNAIISSHQFTLTRYQLNKKKIASSGAAINYNNLSPYFSVVPQRLNYTKAPEIINGELFGRLKTKRGMFKYYGYANYNTVSFNRQSIEAKEVMDYFGLTNNHAFSILTYNGKISNDWQLMSGAGLSYNKDNIKTNSGIGSATIRYFNPVITNYTSQARLVFTRTFPGLNKLYIGAEYQHARDKIVAIDSIPLLTRKDNYASVFIESDVYLSNKIAMRPGVRYEYSSLMNEAKISPRISLAYKLKDGGQFSAACGMFYQKPEATLLFRNPDLRFTNATHYLLNYQRMKNNQTLRVELFHKQYKDLVTYPSTNPFDSKNDGNGYARGFESFWRDKKSFKNFSYWVAYSYLDTKRKFLDFPIKTQPDFAASHTMNVVMKQWVEKITTMFSMTYTFTSGRHYYNPNLPVADFMTEKTKAYHNAGFQINYLTNIGKANTVFIFNTNNLFGTNQVFTYRFSTTRNTEGVYSRAAVTPMAKRFFFIGIYLSMGTDKRKEVIDN